MSNCSNNAIASHVVNAYPSPPHWVFWLGGETLPCPAWTLGTVRWARTWALGAVASVVPPRRGGTASLAQFPVSSLTLLRRLGLTNLVVGAASWSPLSSVDLLFTVVSLNPLSCISLSLTGPESTGCDAMRYMLCVGSIQEYFVTKWGIYARWYQAVSASQAITFHFSHARRPIVMCP